MECVEGEGGRERTAEEDPHGDELSMYVLVCTPYWYVLYFIGTEPLVHVMDDLLGLTLLRTRSHWTCAHARGLTRPR